MDLGFAMLAFVISKAIQPHAKVDPWTFLPAWYDADAIADARIRATFERLGQMALANEGRPE